VALALSAAIVVATVLLGVVLVELPWWVKAQLVATAVLAAQLGREVLRQMSPVRIDITDDGLVVATWLGTEIVAWSDIRHVTVHPSEGRFGDPVVTELSDMALELRVATPGTDTVETTADVTLVTVPAVDHTALVLAARRLATHHAHPVYRTAGGGLAVA
jgi:hypothetical protein